MKKAFWILITCMAVLGGCAKAEQITDNTTETKKTVLRLGHWEDDAHEVSEPEHKAVSLEVNDLKETEWTAFDQSLLPEDLINAIQEDYDFDFDEGWQMMIHYYDDSQSAGMLMLRYAIDDKITTNKSVTCAIENQKINDIWYTNPQGIVNGEEVLERVRKFEESTVQEQYEFGDGEEYIEETVQYTYNFSNGSLLYIYNLFFYEGEMRVINNSIGCEYLIP